MKFLPDRRGVDGLAKQIKASAKAFPLFDLARLVLEKSERYVVEFRRAGEGAQPVWQVKSDGTLWTSEGEAVTRALAADLGKYYRRERVTVEPPKGAFPFVAVCGMSGTLLGPPNYHDYQTKVMALHQERFANLPFEVYKSRIKMERDEELIEKWREEQSTKDVFYAIVEEVAAPVAAEVAPENAKAEAAAETDAADVNEGTADVAEPPEVAVSEEAIAPIADPVEAAPAAEIEVPEAPPIEVAESVVDEAPVEVEDVALAPVADAPLGEKFETMADVEAHFRANHLKQSVIAIRDKVVVSGPAALNDSAPLVLGLTRGLWGELDRFPLPMAHGLGQQLASKGLQIFKLNDKVTYAGVARPRFLDLAQTPMSAGLSGIYNYLVEHPGQARAEQWAGLIKLRPEDQEDRESAVARDLSWLIHEGYVVDFAKKGMSVLPRATGQKKPSPRPKAAEAAAPEVVVEPVADAETTAEPEIVSAPADLPTPDETPQG